MANRPKVVVYLDKTLVEYLNKKQLEGFNKSALIRRALHVWRDMDLGAEEWQAKNREEVDGKDEFADMCPKIMLNDPNFAKNNPEEYRRQLKLREKYEMQEDARADGDGEPKAS